MPSAAEGRGGAQLKFGDDPIWKSGLPAPRPDLDTIPFIGSVGGETPAVSIFTGRGFGAGAPKLPPAKTDRHGLVDSSNLMSGRVAATSHGPVILTSHEPTRKESGFLPTADAVHFLSSEYRGSRFDAPSDRYFK